MAIAVGVSFTLSVLLLLAVLCKSGETLRLFMHQSQPIQTNNDASKRQISRSLQLASAFLFTGLAVTSRARPSEAVYFDTDVYGDKELKIATVNKMKQKLRNEILNNISLAPIFLKLAINDALGYSVETKDGGPDGSVLFEMDREENKGLEAGIESLKKVQDELRRTNTVAFGDICAFGGVVALESVGCGRLSTQVGRFDAKKANSKSSAVNWNSSLDKKSFASFQDSGLDVAETLLLLSAVAETERIIQESIDSQSENGGDDDTFEPQPFIPSTFGTRDDIFGAKIGNSDFGTEYIKALLAKKSPPSNDPITTFLLAQPNVKSILGKYIGNDPVYRKDVSNVYLKLSTLGSQFTTRNS